MTISQQDIAAATGALRADAGIWDGQVEPLNEIVRIAEDLRINRVEAGIFQVFYGGYLEAVDQIAARVAEGVRAAPEVAAALRQAAATYDEEEVEHQHRIRGLY